MSEQSTAPIRVAIIGNEAWGLDEMIHFLRGKSEFRIVGEFSTIADSFVAGLGTTLSADMVVVVQAVSSEFALDDVNQLIGRMFNARIFCFYGPWCESDGRTHEIWPIAMRVPLGSATAVITQELAAMRHRLPPLSPMSAGEEVFAHRLSRFSSFAVRGRGTPGRSGLIVVSNEVPLWSFVERLGRELGLTTHHSDCDVAAVKGVLKALPNSPDVVVLVDLDPFDATCESLLDWLAADWPKTTVVGMSVFARESFPELPAVESILQKIELHSQLLEQLR